MHLTQSISREAVRCMYPAEFLEILWDCRHPRWFTIGVTSLDSANEDRARVGIEPCGTIYVANCKEKRTLFAIPCNCIPYTSVKNMEWHEEQLRFYGALARGWRPALQSLLLKTYLSPSPRLSWLIGEDTYKIAPHEARR